VPVLPVYYRIKLLDVEPIQKVKRDIIPMTSAWIVCPT
jgi:hypothetical protein